LLVRSGLNLHEHSSSTQHISLSNIQSRRALQIFLIVLEHYIDIRRKEKKNRTTLFIMSSCLTMKRSFDHDRETTNTAYDSRTSTMSKRARRHYPVTIVSSSNEITDTTMREPSAFPDIQPILTAGRQWFVRCHMNNSCLFSIVEMFCSHVSKMKSVDFNDVIN
jgi:hypothetical protein